MFYTIETLKFLIKINESYIYIHRIIRLKLILFEQTHRRIYYRLLVILGDFGDVKIEF